jgi:U3 small nucleolar RNA-associated protein 11
MSSFRNAVKRKTHKERSQPESRKRFGLLEKHKDYVVRARDYNKKKKRLQALQEKARFRNPDEFYMKMQNMATKRGVHTNLGEDSIDADTLKLFKTQDLSYITLKKQSEQTKIGERAAEDASGVPETPTYAPRGMCYRFFTGSYKGKGVVYGTLDQN